MTASDFLVNQPVFSSVMPEKCNPFTYSLQSVMETLCGIIKGRL